MRQQKSNKAYTHTRATYIDNYIYNIWSKDLAMADSSLTIAYSLAIAVLQKISEFRISANKDIQEAKYFARSLFLLNFI